MVARKRGLGRGLDSLLGAESKSSAVAGGQMLAEVPVEWIRPGKYQPRKVMDEDGLAELAASIKAQGVMQPIVLRSIGDERYEIIAGERRWRATQLAGLHKVPAVIKEVNDEAAVAMSLIENIQREDLNPMEEAFAFKRLVDDFDLTHQQVAEAVGKSRTTVTNFLRLIGLSSTVASMLASREIEMGHARALLGLGDDNQILVARDVVAKQLNVRQTEALVKRLASTKPARKVAEKDSDTKHLERQLSTKLGQNVSLKHSSAGKGKLVIDYNSLDELDGILRYFGDLE